MAKATTNATEQVAEPKTPTPKFTKADIIGNARLLGYKPEVVAGALYDMADTATLSKADLKNKVDAFLKKVVGKEGKEGNK